MQTTPSHVLVTGGSGFIGSNFIRFVLKHRPSVRVVNLDKLTYAGNPQNLADVESSDRYRFVLGDICDPEIVTGILREYNVDRIVHFAAESHVDRSIEHAAEFIRTNVVGTHVLLEAARVIWDEMSPDEPRFLHVSTDEVFGSLEESGYFTEETPYDPRSPYSASKAASDHLVRAYHHTHGLPTLITNCSNNYGPFQFPEKLIPLMIDKAWRGNPLPVYGDGLNVRDWLHVEDHCSALLAVLEGAEPGSYFNIGGNAERQNIAVVQTICDSIDSALGLLASGKPRRELITFVKDRAGHDRRYAIDASRIRSALGWEPRIRFEEGIRDTVMWYLENRAWLDAIADGSYRQLATGGQS